MSADRAHGRLRLTDATLLAHALVSKVAEDESVRALTVKGPVPQHYGLRPERPSGDADVLVDPAGFLKLIEALRDLGWVPRRTSRLTSALVSHSVTLISDDWPCDLDVHSRFPGFLRDERVVFEALWTRRETLQVAARSIAIPDRASSILIAALHGLRSPAQDPRHREEVSQLAGVIVPELSRVDLEDLASLAIETGSVDTARPVFDSCADVLPPPTPAKVDQELDDWRLRSASGGGRVGQFAVRFRHSSLPERFRLVADYFWRTPADLVLDLPDTHDSPAGISRARMARVGRARTSIRNLVRGYRYARAGKDDTALVEGENPW